MRVLLTTDTVGGVWTFTRELTEGLLQQGDDVALVGFGRAPSQEQTQWASEVQARHRENFGFSAFDIPLEWMADNERALPEGEAALSFIIDQFVPDLLHANQFCFGALDCGLPRLITAHSDVLSWAEACRPQGLEPSPWLDQYTQIVQRGLDGADAVTAPTHAMLHALGRNFTLPHAQHVIANGRSLPSTLEPPSPRTLQAVTAGRLWDQAKNIALLASINSPIPLLVVGEQSFSPQRTAFEAASLHFTGALPQSDLLRLFRSSAIYIAPSIYEPFGLAPLEAALCECAILANDLPSLREVWDDAAIYFDSATSLEQQLLKLTQSPGLLLDAQQRAKKHALTLSREAMVARYTELYRELASSVRQPGSLTPTDTRIRGRQRVA